MTDNVFALPGLTLAFRDLPNGPFPLQRALAPFRAGDSAPSHHEVVFRQSNSAEIEVIGTTVWTGTLIDGTYAEIGRHDSLLQFRVPGRFSAIETPGRAVTDVVIVRDAVAPLRGMPAMVLLDIALRGHQLLMAHAATMLLPDGSGVVLLFAPSGSGKTTTSLVLALSGYGHLGDDVAVLRRHEGDLRAWGMPRALKVHRRTAAMLPAVQPHLGDFDLEDEARLTSEALATITPVPPQREYPIKAVVLVGKRSDGLANVRKISKTEALSEIIADNVGMLDDGVPRHAQAQFAMLSQLVASTPSFRLDAGSDPIKIVDAFDAALGQSRG